MHLKRAGSHYAFEGPLYLFEILSHVWMNMKTSVTPIGTDCANQDLSHEWICLGLSEQAIQDGIFELMYALHDSKDEIFPQAIQYNNRNMKVW